MTIILDGTTGITTPAINSSGDLELPGGTANGVLYLNGSKVATSGSALVFDGTNLGVGVTPSAWDTLKAIDLGSGGAVFGTAAQGGVTANAFYASGDVFKYKATNTAGLYQIVGNEHRWSTAASGTAGDPITFTTAMTLDASGDLLLEDTGEVFSTIRSSSTTGTRQAILRLNVASTGGNDPAGKLAFTVGNSYTSTAYIEAITNPDTMIFGMGSTERARITSSGAFLTGVTSGAAPGGVSTFNQISSSVDNYWTLTAQSSSSTAPWGIAVNYPNASPNIASYHFFYAIDSTTARFYVRSDGGIGNYQGNDANLSDERVKKDIAPLDSMWDKFKAIEIVTFKYKDQTHDDNNIGVIAQQVESVAPEFVDVDGWDDKVPEDGVPLKSIYTTDMYHAAIKALQEAMTRIENLEAEVSALKGV